MSSALLTQPVSPYRYSALINSISAKTQNVVLLTDSRLEVYFTRLHEFFPKPYANSIYPFLASKTMLANMTNLITKFNSKEKFIFIDNFIAKL